VKRGKNQKRYSFALLVAALLAVCLTVPKPTETPSVQTQPTKTQPTEPTQIQPPTEPTAKPTQPTEPTQTQPPTEPTAKPTQPTEPTQTQPPTEPTAKPTQPPETTAPTETMAPPALTGWQEIGGNRYYYRQDGTKHIGWLRADGKTYFLGLDGVQRTGWMESDGKRYYLNPASGGAAHAGWLDYEGNRYYFSGDGVMQTGWLNLSGNRYYLSADGTASRGKTQIDGKNWYFTESGALLILANPWNLIPEDYQPVIVATENGHRVNAECADALARMLSDCRATGLNPQIASSYRTHGDQIWLYNRKVNYYLDLGYTEADAKAVAGTIIALPGTSEHELGLALDLVDNSNWNLDESQEKTPVQQWLMQNSWRYGFILRYPNGKSDVTGIIYEPWHYRYVGKALAKELFESGLCLEEYLNSLN